MLYSEIILIVAKTVGVPASLLLAICTHETGLNNVISPYDHGSPSYGLCQIKKDTAASLGYKGEPEGLMIPATNAKYAALYLKKQLNRYQGNWMKAIAAFNAGRYNPSKVNFGKPKNFKYVTKVISLLNDEDKIACGRVAME